MLRAMLEQIDTDLTVIKKDLEDKDNKRYPLLKWDKGEK
jgi:hypothetical protein